MEKGFFELRDDTGYLIGFFRTTNNLLDFLKVTSVNHRRSLKHQLKLENEIEFEDMIIYKRHFE